MSSGQRHPHIDNASDDELAVVLRGKDPLLRQIYLDIHRLILDSLPDVMYATDCTDGQTAYGIRQYGYDGWGMAALNAYSRWVSLTLLHGANLEDSTGLLEGTKYMRHVKMQSYEQFEQYKDKLRVLVELASTLHSS